MKPRTCKSVTNATKFAKIVMDPQMLSALNAIFLTSLLKLNRNALLKKAVLSDIMKMLIKNVSLVMNIAFLASILLINVRSAKRNTSSNIRVLDVLTLAQEVSTEII